MPPAEKHSGAWVFVSHPNKDFEPVREARNLLEVRGHKPLLVLLECQEVDDARLPELIRDEIKGGTFFVLCSTRASLRSKWVERGIERGQQVTQRHSQRIKPALQFVVVINSITSRGKVRQAIQRQRQVDAASPVGTIRLKGQRKGELAGSVGTQKE